MAYLHMVRFIFSLIFRLIDAIQSLVNLRITETAVYLRAVEVVAILGKDLSLSGNTFEKKKQERADSNCRFSPNCYLCFLHKKIIEMSRNHGGERYIKSFDGRQHFVRRKRQTVRKVL